MLLGFTTAQWLSFGFVSVLLNLATTSVFYFFRNRRRALATLAAIEFECGFAQQLCTSYKKDSQDGKRAWAPAYRLTVVALEQGIPWLRDHGFLQVKEVEELTRLCLRMEEVNRCLALVEEGVKQNQGNEDAAHHYWSRQSERCALKCDHVLGPKPNNEDGTVPGAMDVINAARHRIRLWLRPISFHRERTEISRQMP
jgi:hypothetical protein